MKKAEIYTQKLRTLLTPQNIEDWVTAQDKKDLCLSLVNERKNSDIENQILSEVLNNLLSKKAEDKFSEFKIGDRVSILQQGQHYPATITKQLCNDSLAVSPHAPLPYVDMTDEPLVFKRAREQVFTRMDGNTFSRLHTDELKLKNILHRKLRRQ